jgi:hypothetical protein
VRVLGTDHPDTLTTRHGLAWALVYRRGQGDLDKAIDLFQTVLTNEVRVLGTDHPDTLATRESLTRALKERGRA